MHVGGETQKGCESWTAIGSAQYCRGIPRMSAPVPPDVVLGKPGDHCPCQCPDLITIDALRLLQGLWRGCGENVGGRWRSECWQLRSPRQAIRPDGARLAAQAWGENMGCRSGSERPAIRCCWGGAYFGPGDRLAAAPCFTGLPLGVLVDGVSTASAAPTMVLAFMPRMSASLNRVLRVGLLRPRSSRLM